jgi:type I restriction enzyme, S subunit
VGLKPGYNHTEVGVIPEDWCLKEIQQVLIDRRIPSGIYKTQNNYGRGTQIIKLGDIFSSDYFDPDSAQRVELSKHEINTYRVQVGDIIVALASVKLEGVGKVLLVDKLAEATAYDHNVALIRLINEVDHRYVFHLFKSNVVRRQVSLGATQVGTTFLKASTVRKFLLPLPSTKTEQRAIAEALGDTDALLGTLDRLIAKKRDLKQAAMQQLLTGQTRLPGFHGNWEVKKLGELGRFLKGSGVTKDQTRSGRLRCVRYGEIYTHHDDVIRDFYSWISPEVASTAVRLKKGDILFAGSGETKEEIGKCAAFVSDIEAYAGGDIVILRPDDSDSLFLGYYLNTGAIARQKASRGQGDAVVHISSTALSDVCCKLPTPTEQAAIAEVLTDMDAELSALAQRREKTRALKQAMMQELLTGKTRLVSPKEAHA